MGTGAISKYMYDYMCISRCKFKQHINININGGKSKSKHEKSEHIKYDGVTFQSFDYNAYG